jgi:hypothetical protein
MRLVLIALLLLKGCGASTPEPSQPCMSAGLADLIGQPAEAAADLPDPKRIYHEGDMVTMDHNPARLNVILDAEGRITAFKCG